MYSADMRRKWQLEDDSWKYDIMPEIMDGRNVADFVDPDIEAQLAQLEKEEDALAAAAALEVACFVHVTALSASPPYKKADALFCMSICHYQNAYVQIDPKCCKALPAITARPLPVSIHHMQAQHILWHN